MHPHSTPSAHRADQLQGAKLLEQVFSAAVDAFILCDSAGRITMCNGAVMKLFGYQPDELYGTNVSILIPEPDAEHHDAYIERHLSTGRQRVMGKARLLQARHKHGHLIPVSLAVTRIGVGEQTMFSTIIRDASQQVSRTQQLQRRNEELHIQASINTIIQESTGVRDLLDRALRCLIGLEALSVKQKAGAFMIESCSEQDLQKSGCGGCKSAMAQSGSASAGDKALKLYHTVGKFSDAFLEFESWVPLGSCLCGRTALSGEVIISPDCFEDPRHEHTFEGMPPHGHYIIPLKARRTVFGVIFLYTEPHPADDLHRVSLLETIGVQLGCAIERLKAEERLRASQKRLLELASRDTLTGIFNRRSVLIALRRARLKASSGDGPVCVALMDIDHFKFINDTRGHAGGDQVLIELTRRVQSALRSGDTLGRYGGEEFLVIMPGMGLEQGQQVAQRLLEAISGTPFDVAGGPLRVTASIGVTQCGARTSDDTDQEAIKRADDALYDAKHQGRARVVAR